MAKPKSKKYRHPKFDRWWKRRNAEERREVAASLGTTVGYLKQIAFGASRPGPALAKRIAAVSGVPAAEFHPEVFS